MLRVAYRDSRARRKLGVGPGSVLEWHEEGEHVVVRRAGAHSSEDIHRVLFPERPPRRRTVGEMEAGIRRYPESRRARG